MTAPAQDWAEKAREIIASVKMWAGPTMAMEALAERIAAALSDAARTSDSRCRIAPYEVIHGESGAICSFHAAQVEKRISDAARTGRAEDAIEIRRLQTELAEWKARKNRAACALADAARMGREEGLEEAAQALDEVCRGYRDAMQIDPNADPAHAAFHEAELENFEDVGRQIRALRGKERS